MHFFILFVFIFLSNFVSAGFNFGKYKPAFKSSLIVGLDRDDGPVSLEADNDLALNSMMDHGIENQAVSNTVQVRVPLTNIFMERIFHGIPIKVMKQNNVKNTLKLCTDLAKTSSDEQICLSVLFDDDYFWS